MSEDNQNIENTPDRQSLRNTTEHEQSIELLKEAARLLHDGNCYDIMILDVRGKSDVTDFLLIATGTSDRQMKSLGDDVAELAHKTGYPLLNASKDNPLTWLLLDFVDVIVHLFEQDTRAHYDIEMMWGEAEQIPWKR